MIRILTLGMVIFCFSAAMAQEAEPVITEEGIDSVRKNKVVFYPGFGVGLVRNTLTPTFHISLGYVHRNRYEGNINTNTFFFFEKGADSKYNIYRNTYLNAEFMLNFSPLNKSLKNWNGVGIGYLIEARGDYITEPSMMIYYKRKYRYFSVMPGIIFDDNFKDVWPVITIRL